MNKLDDKSDKPGITVPKFVLDYTLHIKIGRQQNIYLRFGGTDIIPDVGPDNPRNLWHNAFLMGYDGINCRGIINIEQLSRSNFEKGFRSAPRESAIASGPIVVAKLDMKDVKFPEEGIIGVFGMILDACSHAFPRLIPASPQSLCRALSYLVDENGALVEVFGGPSSEITFCSPVLFCPYDDGFQYAVGIRVGQRVHQPGLVNQYSLMNSGDVRLLFRGANLITG